MPVTTFRRLVCKKLTSKFSDAVVIEESEIPQLAPGQVLVKNRYVGINASDINFTAGMYDPTAKPPFDTGFEAIGEVVKCEQAGAKFSHGQPVLYSNFGAFAEYKAVNSSLLIPLPDLNPNYLPLLVSGLTASLALDKVGHLKSGDKVLVTAAAGGTGQFAVQWAKAKGCTVIGTCSSDDKCAFLKKIGCDRAVNYNKEKLDDVLKAEYPNGIDVVYECIGGDMFETSVKHLAIHGRVIVIGMIKFYEEGITKLSANDTPFYGSLPLKMLQKSASIRGFFLPHFANFFEEYLTRMIGCVKDGTIVSQTDAGESTGKPFSGIEDVTRAVQYMFDKKNIGKVIVELNGTSSSL